MEIGIKNFDLCDVDNEPIRVDYSTISNDEKNTSLIKEKCQFSFSCIKIKVDKTEKNFERKLISFSEFDTFEQNRLKIYEMFSSEWKIISEIMKTTDHFIEIEKEII